MKKLHILSLLVTISLFLPSNISAALPYSIYCAVKRFDLSYPQDSIDHDIKDICENADKELQKDFRQNLKKLIPQSEFEQLKMTNPLDSFFITHQIPGADNTCAAVGSNQYNLIIFPKNNYYDKSMNVALKHEVAHLLHRDCSKRLEASKEYYQNISLAGFLRTIYSSMKHATYRSAGGSYGLFGIYALYNQYKYNQHTIQKEREADAFAIKHTDSIKELEDIASDLKRYSWKGQEKMIAAAMEKSTKGIDLLKLHKANFEVKSFIKFPFLNEMFHDHPQIEERVAKMQEKIDFLKAQEAKLEKNN